MYIHDQPGYDDDTGQPEPFLSKRELEKELQAVGPQCYGLKVHAMELSNIGHIESRPTSRRSRNILKPLEFVPRKMRSDKGKKRAPYKRKSA
jgi:hypothetical protein